MDLMEAVVRRRSYRLPFREEPISEEHLNVLLEAARWAPSPFNIQPWEIALITSPEVKERIARLTERAIQKQFRDPKHLSLVARWTRLTREEWEEKGDGVLIDDHLKLPGFVDRRLLRPLVDNLDKLSLIGGLVGKLPAKGFGDLIRGAPLLMLFLLDRSKPSPGENGWVWTVMSIGAMVQNVHLAATSLGIGVQYVNAALESPQDRAELRDILGLPEKFEPMTLLRLGYVGEERPTSVRRRIEPMRF